MNVLRLDERRLPDDLGTDFIVRETVSAEKRDLLASSNRVHAVDCGNTCLDHFLRVDPLKWVDWLALDIQELFSKHRRALVDGNSRTIEGPAKHLLRNGHFEHFACELAVRVKVVDPACSFEDLDDGSLASYFENLPFPDGSVSETNVDDFCVPRKFDIVEDDQRTIDLDDRSIIDFGSDVIISCSS